MTALEAVVEIGSTGIRLMACEITGPGQWTVIDRSEVSVSLGWDVFTTGLVSRNTLLECLKVLARFKEQLEGWGIDANHVQVIATSAMREAKNRDSVLDRILVKTGFKVKVIDGIEENRLMYIALLDSFKDNLPELKKDNSVIIETGGGSTELMMLEHGKMAAVHSLRMGTVIVEQNMKSFLGSADDVHRYLSEYVHNTSENLNTEISLSRIRQFVTIGHEARTAALAIGKQVSIHAWTIEKDDFNRFVDEMQQYSEEERMARFNCSYAEARALGVGLLTYQLFLNQTSAQQVIVSDTSIREGVILSRISAPSDTLQQEFISQIAASARNLGKRYHIDEPHADYVEKVALHLFDDMRGELGLDGHSRLLLEIAAILHDIGNFIRGSDHQLHSQYIISNSDIFGLTKEDMKVISLVSRYHRGAPPKQTDADFHSLPRDERVTVLKLTALLRIADALDRSHTQKLTDFDTEIKEDKFILHIHGTHDTNLEKAALSEKGDLFETVFGYSLLMV